MASPSIEEVIKKYVELRDRKAELAKRHEEEMAQFSQPMEAIESWLLNQMNVLGVDQLKAADAGTAFKKNAVSVKLEDPVVFKDFVLAPAAQAVVGHLESLGIDLQPVEAGKLAEILRDLPRWDIVDFRAGKKGIQEFQEHHNQAVPGIAFNTISTVQIRRA